MTLALSIALVVAAITSAEPIREDSYVEKNLISDDEVQDLEPIVEPGQEGKRGELLSYDKGASWFYFYRMVHLIVH